MGADGRTRRRGQALPRRQPPAATGNGWVFTACCKMRRCRCRILPHPVMARPALSAFSGALGGPCISGYVAPQMVGLLRDTTGSYEAPMLVVGSLVLLAGVLVPVAARARAAKPV